MNKIKIKIFKKKEEENLTMSCCSLYKVDLRGYGQQDFKC